MLRIQVKYRRFGFLVGGLAVGVKEYKKKRGGAISPFAVALDDEREPREIRKRVRAEILKRMNYAQK